MRCARAGRGGRKPLRSEPPGAGGWLREGFSGESSAGVTNRIARGRAAGVRPRGAATGGGDRPGRWGPGQERCPGENELAVRGRRAGGGCPITHYIWGVTFLTLSVLAFYMPQFVKTLFGLLFFRLVIQLLGKRLEGSCSQSKTSPAPGPASKESRAG